MRILSRIRQFINALISTPNEKDLELVNSILSPGLKELFKQLSPTDQTHGIRVYKKLIDWGNDHPDLLVSSLLHDIGKIKHPLNPIEKTIIVLLEFFFPRFLCDFNNKPIKWWNKPFVAAVMHSSWGAEMVENPGVSPLTVKLIKYHDAVITVDLSKMETELITVLKKADNQS